MPVSRARIERSSRNQEGVVFGDGDFTAVDLAAVGHFSERVDIIVRDAGMSRASEFDGAVAEQNVLSTPGVIRAVVHHQFLAQSQRERTGVI